MSDTVSFTSGPASGNLPFKRRLAYGVGHVLNDLCASMWFSYLLVFFHNVVKFNNAMAGYVMLVGQVADAVCTPFIGYESDRTQGWCRYTKRKSWHLLGTICVAASFPFLFIQCIHCSAADAWAKFIYYTSFVVIFQIGWAATQISHLSLIPELSPNEGERVELNAVRYAFTVISNIVVYATAWILLSSSVNSGDPSHNKLDPHDAPQFRDLALAMVGLGIIFSIIFHVGTKEQKVTAPAERSDLMTQPLITSSYTDDIMLWQDWLKEPQFYQVAALYMFTRLLVNISQIYLPMYLLDTLNLEKKYIAIVPLVVYICSFIGSVSMRMVNKIIGRKITYIVGAGLVIGGSAAMYFIPSTGKYTLAVFGPACLLGLGGATVLITSLSITADLIGDNTNSGAFVYGAMSFTDKLSNGVAVLIIQHIHPCKTVVCCPACQEFYRHIITFVPGGCAVMAILVTLTLMPITLGRLRKFRGRMLQDENRPLLGSSDSNVPEPDCYDYLCCLAAIEDPQAKSVTQSHPGSQPLTGVVDSQPFSYGSSTARAPTPGNVQYEPIGS